MEKKRIPLRKCLCCQQMKPKAELIRVVKNKEGAIAVDVTGKLSGRGAYICRNVQCIGKARKQKRLERAFSCSVSAEIYNTLEEAAAQDG